MISVYPIGITCLVGKLPAALRPATAQARQQ